jgi:hypothetical protein
VRNLGNYKLINNIFDLNYACNIEYSSNKYVGVPQNVQAPANVPRVKEVGEHWSRRRPYPMLTLDVAVASRRFRKNVLIVDTA